MLYDADFDLGWCHACETFQRVEDAPIADLSWLPGDRARCCIFCGQECPWGSGVWNAGRFLEGDPPLYTAAELIQLCTYQQCGYPGDLRPELPLAIERRPGDGRRQPRATADRSA